MAEGVEADVVVAAVTELCRRSRALPGGAGVACGVASTADAVGAVTGPGDLIRLADVAQYQAKRARSVVPVVAGRPLPRGVADAARLPAQRGDGERRAVRGSRTDHGVAGVVAILDEVVGVLDHGTASDAIDRLALVGDAVARLVDAASWWISAAPHGSTVITERRHGAYRAPRQPGAEHERLFSHGVTVDLTDYPDSLRAIRGDWFAAHVDDPAADPRERDYLVGGGFSGVVGAGGRGSTHDWLLEVFTDADSRWPVGLGPALRALVALALSAAVDND